MHLFHQLSSLKWFLRCEISCEVWSFTTKTICVCRCMLLKSLESNFYSTCKLNSRKRENSLGVFHRNSPKYSNDQRGKLDWNSLKFYGERNRITRHYNAKLQTTKKTLTTSKHSIEFTYCDFPYHFKVNRDKLALTNRRWMRNKSKRLTITVNFQEQNSGSEEKIRPVGRIVKSWTGHVRMISQSNLRI